MMRVSRTLLALALLPALWGARSAAEKPDASPDLDLTKNLPACVGLAQGDSFSMVSGDSRGRPGAIGEARFAGERQTGFLLRRRLDLSSCASLRLDVFAPKAPAPLHAIVFFVDEDNCWYQTAQPRELLRTRWTTLDVDLRSEAAQIEPRGHSRPWGPYVARVIKEFGLCVFADTPSEAGVGVDRILLSPAEDPRGASAPLCIYNLECTPGVIPRCGRFEATFDLSRTYENPFDPEQVDVTGVFETPSGGKVRVPGFFYQDYTRRCEQRIEILTPAGAPGWRIRFAPREPGTYRWTLEVSDGDTLRTDPAVFECVASEAPGCVQVCPTDARYLQFENGGFFYPIGHNIPATFNAKGAYDLGVKLYPFEGTFAYDRYLEGMRRGGENYARIWLAAWSFGLEWSAAYHPSYRGLGRYNLAHAWQLDRVMDKAAQEGVYVQLALTTFGHFRQSDQFEGDWNWSPYSTRQGGPLRRPEDFWTDEAAQKTYQRMVRYAAARWGASSHLAAWEISNEIDLISGYPAVKPQVIAWHERCMDTLRQFDPNPHLVTTNFANWTNDADLLKLPGIAFSSTNHYNVQIADMMRTKIFPLKQGYGKPALMAECGYDFKGAAPETTRRYLRLSLWASYMVPFGGAGLSWWWDFIDDQDLYPLFRPLAEYARGEDRRNRGLEMTQGRLTGGNGAEADGLRADSLQNAQGGYFWVYEARLFRAESDPDFTPAPREGITLHLKGLENRTFCVEFWDTQQGVKTGELTREAKDGTLQAPLPPFTGDIAGKVKPVSAP